MMAARQSRATKRRIRGSFLICMRLISGVASTRIAFRLSARWPFKTEEGTYGDKLCSRSHRMRPHDLLTFWTLQPESLQRLRANTRGQDPGIPSKAAWFSRTHDHGIYLR
ncbi:hypothetical protein GGR55DRAFT_286297 [Xylaria sp. FL0064]|nr:hypothetical protein GGR55DRAFT_286297 [Xylaria sp. FL0064]